MPAPRPHLFARLAVARCDRTLATCTSEIEDLAMRRMSHTWKPVNGLPILLVKGRTTLFFTSGTTMGSIEQRLRARDAMPARDGIRPHACLEL